MLVFTRILLAPPSLCPLPPQESVRAPCDVWSSCLFRLFLAWTVSQTFLVSMMLTVLKRMGQILCRMSLFGIHLALFSGLDRLWVLRKQVSEAKCFLIILSQRNLLSRPLTMYRFTLVAGWGRGKLLFPMPFLSSSWGGRLYGAHTSGDRSQLYLCEGCWMSTSFLELACIGEVYSIPFIWEKTCNHCPQGGRLGTAQYHSAWSLRPHLLWLWWALSTGSCFLWCIQAWWGFTFWYFFTLWHFSIILGPVFTVSVPVSSISSKSPGSFY